MWEIRFWERVNVTKLVSLLFVNINGISRYTIYYEDFPNSLFDLLVIGTAHLLINEEETCAV